MNRDSQGNGRTGCQMWEEHLSKDEVAELHRAIERFDAGDSGSYKVILALGRSADYAALENEGLGARVEP